MIRSVLRLALMLALGASVIRAEPAAPAASTSPSSPAADAWSKVSITRGADDALNVTLESDVVRLDYGPDVKPGSNTVYKALALVNKATGEKIGPFDSRYSPSRTEFLTVRHAEQIRTRSPDEVTVRLYFLTRVVDVTLFHGKPFARFNYTYLNDSRHTYDQVSVPGAPDITYFYSGQEAYSEHMGWFGAHDKKEAAFAPYPFSFYRYDWAGGKYLDYKGWLIIGAGAPGKLGYGAILPLAKVRWLKLMARTGGLERLMSDNATVYYYLVPDFSPERALQTGQAFVDQLK